MGRFSEIDLEKIVILHRPVFRKDSDKNLFFLTMPLLGKPEEVEYFCYFDNNYLLFERKRTNGNAVYDKDVFFLAKRTEYSIETSEEFEICETVFSRVPIKITFMEDSEVTMIASLYSKLNLPYFPFAPFSYYNGMFTKEPGEELSCSLCKKEAPFFMPVMMKKVTDPDDSNAKLFKICPRCVSEGKVSNINDFDSDPKRKIKMIFNNTPHIMTKTHEACDRYCDYEPDSGYYVSETWPSFNNNNPIDFAPVFVGYLRKDADKDPAPFDCIRNPDDNMNMDITYQTVIMLELDELGDATEDTEEEYIDAINNADIRVFAHFELSVKDGMLVPSQDGECKGYSVDVTCGGYLD